MSNGCVRMKARGVVDSADRRLCISGHLPLTSDMATWKLRSHFSTGEPCSLGCCQIRLKGKIVHGLSNAPIFKYINILTEVDVDRADTLNRLDTWQDKSSEAALTYQPPANNNIPILQQRSIYCSLRLVDCTKCWAAYMK